MQQIFAVLLSFLLAFCHHLTRTARSEHTLLVRSAANHAAPEIASPALILPDRYQFARYAGINR